MEYNKLWTTCFRPSYNENITDEYFGEKFKFINAKSYWTASKIPEKNTPNDVKEFTYKLYTLEYEKIPEPIRELNQNSYERKLILKHEGEAKNPIVQTKGDEKQEVRYLDASEHHDSYYNYSEYLGKLAEKYNAVWEENYNNWLKT